MHLLLFIFVFCFFLSCEKDDLQEEITTEIQEYSVEDFVLRTVDGHLVFENEKHFIAIWNEIANLDHDELVDWETQNNFTSIHTIFNNANDALENVESPEELNLFKENWEGKVIFTDQAIVDPILESPINKLLDINGFLEVNGVLIKYLDDRAILSKNNSIEDINDAIGLPIGTIDESKGIVIKPVIKRLHKSEYRNMRNSDGEVVDFRSDQSSCQDKSNGNAVGSHRVDGEITVSAVPISFNQLAITVSFFIESRRKSALLGWLRKKSELSISGNGTIGGFSISPFQFTIDRFASNAKTLSGGLGQLALEGPNALPEFTELCVSFSTSEEDCNCTKNVACEICPIGATFDGANCYFTHYPSGSSGFLIQNSSYTFYYTPFASPNPCPHQPFNESGWDGANCLVRWGVPSTFEPFILTSNRGFYTKPKCPCED
jgi:hypothetical protein